MALAYLASLLTGLRPLPQILQEPLLSAMPGPVFGFLIDSLQHAGKVLEEFGLLFVVIFGLGLLGAAYGRFGRYAMAFGAAGWAVTTLVLLPLAGDGLLGLNEGLQTPLIWAVIYAVYAVVLELSTRPQPEFDQGRRGLMFYLPAGIAVLSTGVLALRLVPNWYQAIYHPAEAGLTGQAPELTPTEHFYVVSKNFTDPVVPEQGWALKVKGLVSSPYQLTLADLQAQSGLTQVLTMECISNNVGGDLISTGKFTGVPLRDLLAKAAPTSQAGAIAFHAHDGYTESIPLSLGTSDGRIVVAYALNDQPLEARHGFPARMIIPGHYGMKGPKWLDEIELVPQEVNGYWENQGWDRQSVVRTMSRIDVPSEGELVHVGEVTVSGVAFAGIRGITAVEYSTDGGSNWTAADLKPPLSDISWTLWSARWTPQREGAYTLKVRARDGSGALQPAQSAPSFPVGATGYHAVNINVGR